MVRGRHGEECAGEECRGCQPCTEPHCRVCGVTHAEDACPGCLAETREALTEIRRLCAALPTEAVHRGIESEAMNLLGPVADPEQTGHVAASVRVGRLPADWLEAADNELHPLLVLGTWAEAYLEAFDHPEPARITVESAASYLDRNLTYMAAEVDVPFEDFAKDLRQCRVHVERVLHDGEQVELSRVPCLKCGERLHHIYGTTEDTDHHHCSRCKRRYEQADYLLARAQWLADEGAARYGHVSDAASAAGCPERTVRTWIHRGQVASMRGDTGRLLVWWPDVRAAARDAEIRRLQRKVG
jgi:hypothetical protein